MQPSDLASFTTLTGLTLNSAGDRLLFATRQMDLDDDIYVSKLWMHDGKEARQFTSGPSDAAPEFSPDGTQIAFIRKGAEGAAQLASIPSDGGEATIETDFDLGMTEFQWAPDGGAWLVLATEWTQDWKAIDPDEHDRTPRRITASAYRFDSKGWRHDRRDRYYVVPTDGSDPWRVGDGEANELGAAWSADGSKIAYLTKIDDHRNMRKGIDLLELDVASGTRTVLASSTGWQKLVYAPDGELHGIGNPAPDYPTLTSLWKIGGEDLTGHTDRSVFSSLLPPAMAVPDWTDDGFYIGAIDSGRIGLQRFVGAETEPVVTGERVLTGFTRRDDGTIFFVADDPTSPGELYELTPDGEERCLTRFNDDFRTATPLTETTWFRVESDPGIEVDTWVYTPEGPGPFPVLLNIHGGPASQYGFTFFDEFQVYAGAGFAVVACNPRGSAGRGTDWLQAVKGEGWGSVDVTDVFAALDEALARDDRLAADRVGVMGGSYGGFLTAWLIAKFDRFKSAVVERALVDWNSFSGTSDIARDFSSNYLGMLPGPDHDGLRQYSPLAIAGDVSTPTLIIHSEQDFRCPIEQAEQYFMELLRNNVDVEMIRFPGESHELSRSGTPRHRQERFEFILEWHKANLGA